MAARSAIMRRAGCEVFLRLILLMGIVIFTIGLSIMPEPIVVAIGVTIVP